MILKKSKLIIPLVILSFILTSSCITDPNEKENKISQNISVEEAYQLIEENKNNANFIIIDVRTESEYNQGYIEDAININFYSPDFTDLLDNLKKNNTYLIYCRSGNRSGSTLSKMKKLDFQEVYNLSGGIINWVQEGYPLAEGCPVCSVDN